MNVQATSPQVQVTEQQLTEVFQRSGHIPLGHRLGRIRAQPIGTGQMADTVRCSLEESPHGAPQSCVVKLPVGEGQTAITARHAAVYDREFRFYRELRPEVPDLQCPTFYGSFDVDGEPALVLEDIRSGVQGDQIDGATLDQARLAVDQLATYQARWWNDHAFGSQDWLQSRAAEPLPRRLGDGPGHRRRRPRSRRGRGD
jgi:hypothetical protein